MTNSTQMLSAFMLGIVGTGHCIGMCGPLVLAIPSLARRRSAPILYNLGRATTYTGVGAILGGLGAGLAKAAATMGIGPLSLMARIQIGFSLLAAVFVLLFGLHRLGVVQEPQWLQIASPTRLPGFKAVQRSVTQGNSLVAVFVFGLMMGFLPCGLSYAAFSLALPAGGVWQGTCLTLAFGLGTIPGLLLVGTIAARLSRAWRQYSDLTAGMLMIGMALSLLMDLLFTG